MKKWLAAGVLLFAGALAGAQGAVESNSAVAVDEAATAAAPWPVGDVVSRYSDDYESSEQLSDLYRRHGAQVFVVFDAYRKFLGVTPEGGYLVQDFYEENDKPYTEPFVLMDAQEVVLKEDVLRPGYRSFSGPLVTWYLNGRQQQQVFYVDGGLQGPLMTWYDNGQKREETQFEGNQPHGLWTTWHDNGQKRSELYYEHGRKVGLWRMWDRDGKLVNEQDHGSVAAETVN